jgi:hypothetical protein
MVARVQRYGVGEVLDSLLVVASRESGIALGLEQRTTIAGFRSGAKLAWTIETPRRGLHTFRASAMVS